MNSGGAGSDPELDPQLVGVSALPPPLAERAPTAPPPLLPSAPPKPPVPLGVGPVGRGGSSSAWYRSDQQRYRSALAAG